MDENFPQLISQILSKKPMQVPLSVAPGRAAVSIIFRAQNDHYELLMIERSHREDDPWSGQMAFPGGKQDKTDKDDRFTAERETFEEIGITLSECGQFLGGLNHVQARKKDSKLPFAIAPYVYWLTDNPKIKLDPKEVHAIHWLSVDHFFDPKNHQQFLIENKQKKRSFPCIRWNEHVIWGLSYMMLSDFFKRFRNLNLASKIQKQFTDTPTLEYWKFYTSD